MAIPLSHSHQDCGKHSSPILPSGCMAGSQPDPPSDPPPEPESIASQALLAAQLASIPENGQQDVRMPEAASQASSAELATSLLVCLLVSSRLAVVGYVVDQPWCFKHQRECHAHPGIARRLKIECLLQ